MKFMIGIGVLGLMSACAAQSPQVDNKQSLDVAYCKKIADETFKAGKLRHDLCPGYMNDGQPVELE
jgi:hypothetical protein